MLRKISKRAPLNARTRRIRHVLAMTQEGLLTLPPNRKPPLPAHGCESPCGNSQIQYPICNSSCRLFASKRKSATHRPARCTRSGRNVKCFLFIRQPRIRPNTPVTLQLSRPNFCVMKPTARCLNHCQSSCWRNRQPLTGDRTSVIQNIRTHFSHQI